MLKEIENFKKRIVEKFRPQKIILFGSYAYGTPGDESDVDFLVILPFKGKAAFKAAEVLDKTQPSIPVDPIVRTPGQVKTRLAQNDFFLREVMKRGKTLYEAPY